MNRLINLIFLDFKLLLKSKSFYFKLILFPTILILILGSVFNSGGSKLPDFKVAYYSEDTGSNNINLGSVLKENVLESEDLSSMITLNNVSNYDDGENLVNNGDVSAFVYIPKDFTTSFINGEDNNITLIGNKNTPIDKDIVKIALDRFIQTTKTTIAENKEVQTLANENKLSQDTVTKLLNNLANSTSYDTSIDKVSSGNMQAPINAMQYYSIAMVVMFSILTGFTLIQSIVNDKLNNTLFRIKSTPTLNLQYALGKLAGIIFAIVMQMSIVMLITRLVFNMNWGNVFYILIITIVYAFTIGSMVLVFGLIAKNQGTVSSIGSAIFYGFSFLGGSFISKDALPGFLKTIQGIIPNGKAINSFLKVCQGEGLSSIAPDLIQLVLIGIVFLILALTIYNGKRLMLNGTFNNDKKTIETATIK